MLRLIPIALAFGSAMLVSFAATGQQPPEKKQPAKGKFDPPPTLKPDAATLKTIAEKTEKLRYSIDVLRANKLRDDVLVEIEIFLKAAENIVRFEEWYAKDSVKWTLASLDRGLARAMEAGGLRIGAKPSWRTETGRWVPRAYRSQIDGSIQPYAVLLPADYGKDPEKAWRLDIVLHGRDGSLTEAKFLATHDRVPPKLPTDYIQLEPYGRGNNAYRWAGETDVREAVLHFLESVPAGAIDPARMVLRGFSMGGAGTWHLGLHRPFEYAVIGPGAGFTTTHGYIGGLPEKLPDHQEKCLRIYDAAGYAENAFNVPVVAYSGEKDAQKAAADNIENRLKEFKEPLKFTHLIASGLAHSQPEEWQNKCEAEYKKHANPGRKFPERVRFVTYTPKYFDFEHGSVEALETQYEKAVVDSTCSATEYSVKTVNIAAMRLFHGEHPFPQRITVDGQKIAVSPEAKSVLLVKSGKSWAIDAKWPNGLRKRRGLQGPIDDAFMSDFVVVGPRGDAPFASAMLKQFSKDWDKWFRGTLPVREAATIPKQPLEHVVLFGTPWTNPLIADALPKLPITWTKETLTVNGTEYDAAMHLPVLVYPNPANPGRYLVLNSGHTFQEADLKGTNALLYPRLGDWAVIKPTPTDKNPAAFEVVAAGLFDANWRFAK